jgi:large subunit ribosomal protein L1
MAQGKKYSDALKRFDREQLHTPPEAVELVRSLPKANFDETVELVARLGVDPRKADQIVRGTVGLPAGTGKDVRVAVFAAGEAATAAREAGADIVGSDDLAAQIEGGMLDFDVTIATPDVAKAVADFKGGKVEYRTDRYGNVHVPIGKASFTAEALLENFRAVVDELNRAKPAAAKGRYMRRVSLSSTMGPGIKIDPTRLRAGADEAA